MILTNNGYGDFHLPFEYHENGEMANLHHFFTTFASLAVYFPMSYTLHYRTSRSWCVLSSYLEQAGFSVLSALRATQP
jgi:hypothetical protein